MESFDLVYNGRKGAFEDVPGHWIETIGPMATVPCGPVRTGFCEVAESIAKWFSEEVGEKVQMCDIWPSFEELESGECISRGEDLFDVFGGKYTVRIPIDIMGLMERDIQDARKIIITRHAGAIAWIQFRGFKGTVIDHFDGDVERGGIYVGVLPFPMIKKIIDGGAEFILLSLPALTFEKRGQELTPGEMTVAGAKLTKILSIETEVI